MTNFTSFQSCEILANYGQSGSFLKAFISVSAKSFEILPECRNLLIFWSIISYDKLPYRNVSNCTKFMEERMPMKKTTETKLKLNSLSYSTRNLTFTTYFCLLCTEQWIRNITENSRYVLS